jgi:ATP-dependent RNA helicase RhlE
MLDMGFVHDVRRVIKTLPHERQNLLFSATMPPAIVSLASSFLHDPVHVEVTPTATTVERIEQSVMFVDRPDKKRLLTALLRRGDINRTIVFTRTKHGANRLAQQLDRADITAVAIHGNKSQNARRRALEGFRDGDVAVLIATDIAARGLDIDDVSHIFNYDLPNEPDVYVHRIGRTGRAGRSGVAISFCDQTEGEYLRAIERTIGQPIPVDDDHEFHLEAAIPTPNRKPTPAARKPSDPSRGGRGRSRGGRGGRGKPSASPASPRPSASPRPRSGNAASPRSKSAAGGERAGGERAPARGDAPSPSRRRRRRKPSSS